MGSKQTWEGWRQQLWMEEYGYSFWKRNVLRFDLNESWKGFCQRWRGRSFYVEGPKTKKVREPTVESLMQGIWRPESIRSRVESVGLGGYVKLKIVTEIRQSSVGATFIAASVYDLSCTKFFAGLGASAWQWRDWSLKQRSGVLSFYIFSVWGEQHSSVSNDGCGQRKQVSQTVDNCSSWGVTVWVRRPVSL